jgi:hypothetical protein
MGMSFGGPLANAKGIDPKLVADQQGHGVDVYLNVYTFAKCSIFSFRYNDYSGLEKSQTIRNLQFATHPAGWILANDSA